MKESVFPSRLKYLVEMPQMRRELNWITQKNCLGRCATKRKMTSLGIYQPPAWTSGLWEDDKLCSSLTCCDPSPFTMCGIMATSPFSNGGSSSGIWSVIIIVTYIHGEFSSTGFLQEKHRLETLQNPPVLSWISPLRRQPEQDTSCG